MKKTVLFLFALLLTTTMFSQNYIGKSMTQIIIQEKWVVSQDSTDMWEKKNINIDMRDFKSEGKLRIHDLDNYKIITCNIENDTCTSFMVVYYNLNKKHVEKLLTKKYNYDGNQSWVCCSSDSRHLELCLREEPGNIFIIEACHFMVNQNIINNKGQTKL